MAHYEWDEFGQRFRVEDDGSERPAPETSAPGAFAIAAGKQTHDLKRGLQNMVGIDVSQESEEAEAYMEPLEEEYPISTMLGSMLPTLAAGRVGMGGILNVPLQAGMGALEGYLDYDADATGVQRASAGALGALGGEVVGRMLGRVLNSAKGVAQDILLPRGRPANPRAADYEALGGDTLAYQRLEQNTPAADLANRAARGAETAINPSGVVARTMANNDALHRAALVEAVGLDPSKYDVLGTDFIRDATDRFADEFQAVARYAGGADDIVLNDVTASKLAKLPEIKELIDLDDFEGLASGRISGEEWMTAREALTEAAANRMQNGRSKAGAKIYDMVDELDAAMGEYVPDEFLGDYARLREQYRVFTIAERPNAIGNNGQINIRTLRNALDSKASGFGRTATGGAQTVNTESRNLIDLMQAADNPEFKAFASSGTAENLQLGQTLDDMVNAGEGLTRGDPRPLLGLGGKLMAPSIIGASQMGGGRSFQGAFTPSPTSMARAGGFTGRSVLDEALYPFVGVEDERQP